MARALSLYMPLWAIDLSRRRRRREQGREGAGAGLRDRGGAEPAVLLVSAVGQRQLVEACCPRAAARGVRPGMTLAHARALIPRAAEGGARVEPFTPERDAAALRALAVWAMRFSPLVTPDPSDGLLMEIDGCEHLFGGERGLIEKLLCQVRTMGFAARVGIGPSFGCAWAVARHGDGSTEIVPESRVRETLARLPVRALRIDEETIAGLREVGITRIGHVLDLPRASVPARFGELLLLRLDQAMGTALETITPVRPREPVRAEIVFDGPTTHQETLEAAARDALADLTGALLAQESGVACLDVSLARADEAPARFAITLSRASRSPRHLWSLLRPHLERVHMGFGIEGILLVATRTRRLRHEQEAWAGGGHEEASVQAAMGELVDTMVNRLGPERIVRAVPVETHIPERAFRMTPVLAARKEGQTAAITDSPRPSLLLSRPEPMEVIAVVPDGPVVRLRWRGREQTIVTTIGPERIGAEWWRASPLAAHPTAPHAPTRDYYRVQDRAGRWLWIYRELEMGRWFVHGEWA
jgi:protein ImuB